MIQGSLNKTIGNCKLFRREYYCGRTTAIVEWYVVYTGMDGKERQTSDYKTKRDAVADIEMFYSK